MFSDPLAYFITWTCYGTWIPGEERSWTKWNRGEQIPQPLLADWCRDHMNERPVLLNEEQRAKVHETIQKHCEIRGWQLHAVNCRSNHCHVVVSAKSIKGEQIRDEFKAWCTRRLKELELSCANIKSKLRERWWTRKGSVRYLFDPESLNAATLYTLEAQDAGGSKGG